ncbi:hypothetical protein EAH87_11910 [Sphingomonas koreensis]|nr:hypothetical protein EAH87_11910 [Sphingomonas koreensis]
MADRVSVSITIGGDLAASARDRFVATVAGERLSVEWDGLPFDAAQLPERAALRLYAHEVAWGRLDDLEALCVALALPFVRWSGGYCSEWSPEILVFKGYGETLVFVADEQERVVIDRATVAQLGTYAAVLAHFDAADFVVPPLRLIG